MITDEQVAAAVRAYELAKYSGRNEILEMIQNDPKERMRAALTAAAQVGNDRRGGVTPRTEDQTAEGCSENNPVSPSTIVGPAPTTPGRADDRWMREIIDATWGVACDDGSVPSTKLQDKIIALLAASPSPPAQSVEGKDALVLQATALLDLDAKKALSPHGIGGLAQQIIERLLADRATLTQALAEAETHRERQCCTACGTVTRDKTCDCNRYGEDTGTQNLVNYADELQKEARRLCLELTEADNVIRQLDNDESWLWPAELCEIVSRSLVRSTT